MSDSKSQITPATVRALAQTVGIRPEDGQLPELAKGLAALVAAVERCDALNLAVHEPATTLRLSGGAVDAEL